MDGGDADGRKVRVGTGEDKSVGWVVGSGASITVGWDVGSTVQIVVGDSVRSAVGWGDVRSDGFPEGGVSEGSGVVGSWLGALMVCPERM